VQGPREMWIHGCHPSRPAPHTLRFANPRPRRWFSVSSLPYSFSLLEALIAVACSCTVSHSFGVAFNRRACLLTSAHHAEPYEHDLLCLPPQRVALDDPVVIGCSLLLVYVTWSCNELMRRVGRSGTTPSTSATKRRRQRISSDASSSSTRPAEALQPSSKSCIPSSSSPLLSFT